ncbi:F-box protein SKIP23-like [Tripterygium wilfordii]|uniref:F-box protein SKIP23-like n=1 Tax=Tripterygium wilfordii TaxID=458696 RepID=UPI0018F7E86A|nr:F-box protein SKIP23-like [Tripterygium wilfordii]
MAAEVPELNLDVIGEIVKRIDTVEDLVVVSRVCPSWRLAAIKEKKNWVSGRQLPWLVLAETEGEDDSKSRGRGFFSLYKNKRYNIDVPGLRGCRIWGSNHGWIVAFGLDLQIHLVNPLSGSKLSLPPQSTFKNQPKCHPSPQWYRDVFIHKALVLKRPSLSGEQLVVAAWYGGCHFLAIARPGDETWTEVESVYQCGPSRIIRDVACCNGQIFALGSCGTLVLCEFDGPYPPNSIIFAPPPADIKLANKLYLVESMGDLLMVVRVMDWDDDYNCGYETSYFDVHKFNFKTKEWTELENLGDMALFVGDSYSMSLSSTEVAGCVGNRIYFTDDNFDQWDSERESYGGHDIGVFDMEECTIHALPLDCIGDGLRSAFSCPVWLVPSLF